MTRVLVVGGTGVFGDRLVTVLLESTGFDVVLAARDAKRLAAAVARLGRVSSMVMDVQRVTAADLRATGAFAVVDAAGPFQLARHRLAAAAIEAGLHYVDLADARDFVAGFADLDAAARAAGVVALTGASSTPALSNAALDAITVGWRAVHRVEVALSPGNRAPRGLSVMRSILSYAGRPVRVFDGGRWGTAAGWGMVARRDMPGLGRRFLSLVDVPDLDVIPTRLAVRDSVVFRAGLELAVLHLGLFVASLAVRLGLVRSLLPAAKVFRWVADRFFCFGTDRGGMMVWADGLDADGRQVRGSWWVVAEGGDGPFIPTLPAVAVLRALADGRLAAPGAGVCAGVLPLAWIEAEFRGRRITSGMSRVRGLYETVLGDAFAAWPQALRRLHAGTVRARGEARVDGAEGWIARLAARVLGLPGATERVALAVSIEAADGRERWVRDFGGTQFASVFCAGERPGVLVERFGVLRFELGVSADASGVTGMVVLGWRIGPVRLPCVLAPGCVATEDVDARGRFRFDVELLLPFGLGRVVRYRGWLVVG